MKLTNFGSNVKQILTLYQTSKDKLKASEEFLSLPISDGLKIYLLTDEKLLSDYQHICKIAKELVVLGVNDYLQKVILSNELLRKNIRYIFPKDKQILIRRSKVGLDTTEKIITHLTKYKKGTNLGCGCLICRAKYQEYHYNLKRRTYIKEYNKAKGIEENFLSLVNKKKDTPLQLPIDPFKLEFLNRSLGIFTKYVDSKKIYKWLNSEGNLLFAGEPEDLTFTFNNLSNKQEVHILKGYKPKRPNFIVTDRERATRQYSKGTDINIVLKRLKSFKEHLIYREMEAAENIENKANRWRKFISICYLPY